MSFLNYLIFLLFFVLVVACIWYGFFILFKKKKVVENCKPKWFSKIGEAAQAVHQREMDKKLPRIYSMQWFKEYWQGKRSLFYAILALNFTVLLPASMIFALLTASNPMGSLKIGFILALLFFIFQGVSVWRCSNNSTPFFKYFGKVLVLLWCLTLINRAFLVF